MFTMLPGFRSLTATLINYLLLRMVKRKANATHLKQMPITNTLPQTKKERYSMLDAMAAPGKGCPDLIPQFPPGKMISQKNCRQSYKH